MTKVQTCLALALFVVAGAAASERSSPAQQNRSSFEVTMVARTITVINYEHRGGSTQIGFQGSPIMPNGKGSGKVESKQGRIQISADFQKLSPPQLFGPEYLTFVLWAITPEGKSNNLGEILLDGDKSKISVTTSLQTFGLIVTAEPYFAVSTPSNAVVLEMSWFPARWERLSRPRRNISRSTRGSITTIFRPRARGIQNRNQKLRWNSMKRETRLRSPKPRRLNNMRPRRSVERRLR